MLLWRKMDGTIKLELESRLAGGDYVEHFYLELVKEKQNYHYANTAGVQRVRVRVS